MSRAVNPDHISAVRRFARFFTRRIGVLEETLHGSDLTLMEARILFEISVAGQTTAADLAQTLGVNTGYLSRVLKGIGAKGLVSRAASDADGRQHILQLSSTGRAAFQALDAASQAAVGDLLKPLPEDGQVAVVEAMRTIEGQLDGRGAEGRAPKLRPLRPGDLGWVISRHGALYAEEYGWDQSFEVLVAKIAVEFMEKFDPEREAAWIAELDGKIVGSAFVVTQSKSVAKLRLVYVEPSARGAGVGRLLVETAMQFSRGRGYRKMTLWTNDVLVAARRLYERLGFHMTASEAYRGFGKDLVSETWERDLRDL